MALKAASFSIACDMLPRHFLLNWFYTMLKTYNVLKITYYVTKCLHNLLSVGEFH